MSGLFDDIEAKHTLECFKTAASLQAGNTLTGA
jgi:hypothetical protein